MSDLYSLIGTAETLGEEEFLAHPRPYSPKDVIRMQVASVRAIEKKHPILWRIFYSQDRYSIDELEREWLYLKAGEIE